MTTSDGGEGGSRWPWGARGLRAWEIATGEPPGMHEPGFSECRPPRVAQVRTPGAPSAHDRKRSGGTTTTRVPGAADADLDTGVIGGPTLHDDTIRLVEHDSAGPEL